MLDVGIDLILVLIEGKYVEVNGLYSCCPLDVVDGEREDV
jgi:hypothetical protein